MTTTLDRVLTGRRTSPPPQMAGIHDAMVTRATATTLHFTISAYSPTWEFGPAPYQSDHPTAVASTHSHQDSPTPLPPKGTPCVVAFVGAGIDRPRVLVLYGWPG